ncbi:la-related protein 1B-like [Uloborus diversus]|uniref:la-related protein 1B-like n=1 Tax=Uloborus diversus TaxID=327109 RepID=UPI002409CB53|nr:la-related protein 1B-like [Uloborus diversus]
MTSKLQSNMNTNIAETDDKSLSEWPTLSDVCSNMKHSSPNGNSSKNAKTESKRTNSPTEKTEGEDSAKENEDTVSHTNGRGARKKGTRQKWVPVPIAPPPYRKRFERFNGKASFENDRKSDKISDKKSENYESSTGLENSRGISRSFGRFRGKRGRISTQSWRQRREEISADDVDAKVIEGKSETDELSSGMFYDPYVHNCYAAAAMEKELKKAIRNQIEYYFSEENLVNDIFMRRKMDDLGYVPLSLIAEFRRVKNLTKNKKTIVEALNESDKLEVLDNMKVRPVVDPLKWPLFDYDSHIFEFRYDVPEFVPGQPYISSLIDGIEGLNFYEDVYPDYISDGYVNGPENHFDMITQNTAVQATG